VTTFSVLYRSERFVISGPRTVLGRAPWCDIPLASARASREHAELVWEGDELTIADLSSLNGTMVNGDRITSRRPLASGDVIVIGAELLLVMDDRDVARRVGSAESARNSQPLDEDTLSEEGQEIVATRTNRDQVELVELLVRGAERTEEDRLDSAPALCRAIDNLAAYFGRSSRRREDTAVARVRLRRLAAEVAGWFPRGDLDAWREDLERRLDTVLSEPPPPRGAS
jgi:pSer/pThr/pTyr-binding forkhead associated (FHA) protein